MGTFYERCEEHRERIRSCAIAGYLRFRSSFFLTAIVLLIFYTVCVVLSTTVDIWSPFLDSGGLEKGSGQDFAKVPSEVAAIPSPVSASSSKASASPSKVPTTDSGNTPTKDPVTDLGKHLGIDPVIDVGYTKYQGITHRNGVTQWLGIRYAAPPLGHLRFAEPRDPHKEPPVQRADKHGKKCLEYRKSPDDPGFNEDCLFLDLYVPANATTGAKLPVLFNIPAGGFNYNAGADADRSGLIIASKGNIIVVRPHYRVGPYGFIASKEIRKSKNASTNNGLKDQRKALEWVQRHISKVGGDPNHVVLGGGSAGGASVSLQMAAYGGRDDKLFHAAIAQSASFGPVLDVAESQYQYNYLVHQLGCVDAHDSLACLRSKPAAEIQLKNINIPYPDSPNTDGRKPTFMWNPVIDNDILQDHTYRAFREGKFVRVPAIFGDDTNGGSYFAPNSTQTVDEFNSFLAAQFPALTRTQLDELDILYTNTSVQFPNRGRYWRQTGTAYGEMRYMCPNLFLTSAMAQYEGAKGWNYRYNVEIPRLMKAGFGVPHVAEMNALWGPSIVRGNGWKSYLDRNKEIVPVIQAYWLSFIRTYDPNTLRHPGSPEWEEWDPRAQRRLVLQTNQTRMEVVDQGQQERCAYLDGIAIDIQQ